MAKEPKPGEWRGAEVIEVCKSWQLDVFKPEIYFANDLISIYTAFKEQVYDPKSVLYPSCAFDASPARVFPNVTFVDIEQGSEGCIKALQKAGFKAHKVDIKKYKPAEEHDLLILLNPAINPDWATQHLVRGGHVIANDYHNSATHLARQPNEFLLWGTIDFVEKDRRKEDNRIIVSRNLEDLFVPVKDLEEFARLRPDDFKFTKEVVESFADRGKLNPAATLGENWEAYRTALHLGMPHKREADRYIFVKK